MGWGTTILSIRGRQSRRHRALAAEEANLLHARRLARRNGWWGPVISTMQGLRASTTTTGRRAEWKGLVEEIVPDFVDPATDGPRPGREEDGASSPIIACDSLAKCGTGRRPSALQDVFVAWNRTRGASPGHTARRGTMHNAMPSDGWRSA